MINVPLASQLSGHPLVGIALAFGGGLLASLSPCLYPMIPITLSIAGGAQSTTRRRRIGLALVYVVGLAATYSALGLIAGLSGTMLGTISTNPWLYFAMANVMLIAAARYPNCGSIATIRRGETTT